jgi:hypothetical protein
LFDTDDANGNMEEHHVWAKAGHQPVSGDFDVLLGVKIPVTWYEYHEFAIERTASEVIYFIDGQEKTRVADTFGGALPAGVWNDRGSSEMLTDWVEVVPEPATLALLLIGGVAMLKRRR